MRNAWQGFRRLVRPPYFSDKEQSRRATVLNVILWVGITLVLAYGLFSLTAADDPRQGLGILLALVLLHALCLYGLHRGYVRRVALAYVGAMWLVLFASSLFYGQMDGAGARSLVTTTLIAGILLGARWALGFAALGAVSVAAAAWLQESGRLVITPQSYGPGQVAAGITVHLLLVAAIIWLQERSLRQSDESAQYHQSRLTRRDLQLDAINDIATATTEAASVDALIHTLVNLLADRFDLYCVLLYQVDREAQLLQPRAISQNEDKADTSAMLGIPFNATSIVTHVYNTGRSYLTQDVSHDPFYLHSARLPQTRSELALPIRVAGELFGVLDVLSKDAAPLGREELRTLEVLANHVGTSIHNRNLLEATQRHRDELIALQGISNAALAAKDEDELIARSTQIVGETLYPENFGVLLVGQDDLLHHHPSYQERGAKKPPPIPMGTGITGLVAMSGWPMRVGDISQEPKYIPVDKATRSELCVPIKLGDKVIGVVNAESRQPHVFSQSDEDMLSALASQLAVAIERARLLDEAQQRAEELMLALGEQAELVRLKDEFIQNVSHEFRTPLAIVSGYVEILESGEFGKLPEEYRQPVDIIARRVRLLSALVDDLTSILEVHAAKQRFETINLNNLLENLQQSLVTQAMAENHQLSFNLGARVPPIHGEATFLRKAVENLVSNALKFTPAGGQISVNLSARNGMVSIEVKDNGIGIPDGEEDRIFDRFYQVDGSATRPYGGTGLGLALVKEVVDLHKGEIKVHSKQGQGSRFTIQLPAQSQTRLI